MLDFFPITPKNINQPGTLVDLSRYVSLQKERRNLTPPKISAAPSQPTQKQQKNNHKQQQNTCPHVHHLKKKAPPLLEVILAARMNIFASKSLYFNEGVTSCFGKGFTPWTINILNIRSWSFA